MLIFATCTMLTGIYMLTGHKLHIFDNRPAFKNVNIEGWKNIGKYTILVSLFIYLVAIIAIIFNFE